MALVMLTVVGLLVGAALTYSGTSLRTTNNCLPPEPRLAVRSRQRDPGRDRNTSATTPRCRATCSDRGCMPDASTYTDPKVGDVTVDACPQTDSLIYEGEFRAVLLTLGATRATASSSATTAT